MSTTELIDKLRRVRFLHDIGDQDLERLANISQVVEFPASQVIFREGEPLREFFLIVSGSVSLEVSAPGVGSKRIYTVTDGELLGISPVLEQTQLTATARTTSPTVAIQLNAGQVLTLCEQHPEFGFEFMRRAALAMALRLSATRLQLANVFGKQPGA